MKHELKLLHFVNKRLILVSTEMHWRGDIVYCRTNNGRNNNEHTWQLYKLFYSIYQVKIKTFDIVFIKNKTDVLETYNLALNVEKVKT